VAFVAVNSGIIIEGISVTAKEGGAFDQNQMLSANGETLAEAVTVAEFPLFFPHGVGTVGSHESDETFHGQGFLGGKIVTLGSADATDAAQAHGTHVAAIETDDVLLVVGYSHIEILENVMVLVIIATGKNRTALVLSYAVIGFLGHMDGGGFGVGSAADLNGDVPETVGGKGYQHGNTAVGILPGEVADVVVARQQNDASAPDLTTGFDGYRVYSGLDHILVIIAGAKIMGFLLVAFTRVCCGNVNHITGK
jgi:hypothetical protein